LAQPGDEFFGGCRRRGLSQQSFKIVNRGDALLIGEILKRRSRGATGLPTSKVWMSNFAMRLVKGGMKDRIAQLRKMGIRSVRITGDNPLIAAAIASEAGVLFSPPKTPGSAPGSLLRNRPC